jgi:PAS domain-containing protein
MYAGVAAGSPSIAASHSRIRAPADVRPDEGDRSAMHAISTPSSEAMTVEDRLAQERAILQYIVDNIPYFIFWKDRESTYLGCNQGFATLSGLATRDR